MCLKRSTLALWLNIFKGKMYFFCVWSGTFDWIYATGLDGQFSFVAYIYFFDCILHLLFKLMSVWYPSTRLDEENSAPKRPSYMNLTTREMEILDSNHRVVSPYDLLFPGTTRPTLPSRALLLFLYTAGSSSCYVMACPLLPCGSFSHGKAARGGRDEGERRERRW